MPFFDKNKKKEKNTRFELHPKNLDKKNIPWGQELSIVLF